MGFFQSQKHLNTNILTQKLFIQKSSLKMPKAIEQDIHKNIWTIFEKVISIVVTNQEFLILSTPNTENSNIR